MDYRNVMVSAMVSQITGVTIVYLTVCSGADQRKHQSSMSVAFLRGIHRSPVNSQHKGPVTRKKFPFDDVIMDCVDFWQETTWTFPNCSECLTPYPPCQSYRRTSSISRTKFQNLNVSCIHMQLSSLNPLKLGVKLRMKMLLEQRRQAMLQLHLSYQQFYCLLRCDLY